MNLSWFKTKPGIATTVVAGALIAVVAGGAAFAAVTPRPPVGRDANNMTHVKIAKGGQVYVNGALTDSPCPTGYYCTSWNTAPLSYGVGSVWVKRGTSNPTSWAEFTTTVGAGNNMGDSTGGTFRFTCSDAQAPCQVSAKAFTDNPDVFVYPRLDIMRQDLNGGAETYCEYADGTDNDGGAMTVGHTQTALTLGVGGSLDCGTSQTLPASGVVDEIDVPAGHYDVATTFYFKLPVAGGSN